MFEIYFLFLLTIFMKNIEEFNYFLLIDDETLMTYREIIKILYKINLNKTFEINEIINKTLQQLVRVVVEPIYFLFDKYIKKKFNHRILKRFLQ